MDGLRGVLVGVRLGREPGRVGEWLADGAAFDAAGADALWVECGPEWDVLALAAALAVVTFRARLIVATTEQAGGLGRTVGTIGRLSQGRFAVVGDAGLAGWEEVAAPEGREAWRGVLEEAARKGVRGVVVPADPRVLDILRNPDEPGERHDLRLAQG